ncbi:hypothetical protein [Myxosarcina sp. GI1(2024)]
MLTKIYTVMALAIAIYILHAAYTNRSALVLRQQTQPQYNPRYGTRIYGGSVGGVWQPSPTRSSYGSFRGGGSGSGK